MDTPPAPSLFDAPTLDSVGCDCMTIRPDLGAVPPGLAVHAASRHVRRRLTLHLQARGVPHERSADGVWLPQQAFGALGELLTAFSSAERTELLAAPCAAPDRAPVAWQVGSLDSWITRLTSGWFHEATEHLRFHLQPIADLKGGGVYGYEALVRAEGHAGLIGADSLLQAAAAQGQGRAFDAHARRGAITQAYPQLQPGEVLFINFAPGVIYNPDVCLQTTFQACREVGADFRNLLFEVTESEAFPDLKLLRRILERYRAEGAQVALDDLGAGHTSLTYLSVLRPDVVKLDRALVSGVHGGDPRAPLIHALIRYAHDLGIRVVAEGVETAQELRLVRELGADYAQGYFLGRPAPTPAGLSAQSRVMWSGA